MTIGNKAAGRRRFGTALSGLPLLAFSMAHAPFALAAETDPHLAEGACAGLPQFDPTWFASQVFWLVVAFAVMYTVFSNRILPDLSSTLENRREHIQSDLETAEKLKSEADKAHDAYRTGLESARRQAAGIIAGLQENLKAKAEAQTAAFRERADHDVRALEARIESAKAGAMEDMQGIAAEVASEAARKIVGIDTDIKKARTVVKALNGREAA